MSPLEQVLAAAKSIATSGKTPSLALIKTKLGNSVPMPILIQGLQQYKSMSQDLIDQLPEIHVTQEKAKPKGEYSEIAELKKELMQLKAAYKEMNERLTFLEENHKVEK
ncbi:hypothetical protein EKG38_10005 [Shewanella canadensis]|uniref:KfrA N-terminal DNA-binding domain-containing protein n=1 Tax=Shewanella canadensis TaxID=271096 RepID=A0A3S0J6Y2_9GAMM|nr:hypothetical protein [Shewanella canadensis]RTR39238.1 hypothetical protein EKG38_10005 [Shewanella canadensis]